MSGPLGSAQWMYASGAEAVQQSLKFNDDESQYLSWTPAAAGNRRTWTYSVWLKRGANITATVQNHALLSNSDGSQGLYLRVNPNDPKIDFACGNGNLVTNALYRDHSAWYHIVAQYDSANSTMKLYVNGEQVTDLATNTQPSLNTDGNVNDGNVHYIGRQGALSRYLDGYLSDIHFIDGQALNPTSFGQFTNGYWEKKDYAGAYGTNGFHLTFQDDVVSEGFNAVTWRGTGANQSISGLGFEPDLVWSKTRDVSQSHSLFDTVRGAQSVLYSDYTGGESSLSSSLVSFDSDGFTVGSGSGAINNSGRSYVSWAWDAGSGSPVSNTDGTITSTVKANPDYGFSIGTFTKGSGTETFGHGLSSAPELLILKRRDSTGSWFSYSSVTGATKWIRLNGTDAATTDSTFWNNTAPTSSVATISTAYNSGEQLVFYAWNSVAGYSSIGSYSGTGVVGNSVTGLGFKPAFVVIKRTDSTGDWRIVDNTRSVGKYSEHTLYANDSAAEVDLSTLSFDSDGFSLQSTAGSTNASGGTYIYMAFADTREAAFWKDVSGQGNHWTPNNLDYRDSLPDSPANNFATWNPLASNSNVALSEGNLKATLSSTGDHVTSGTMAASAGSFYAEFTITNLTSSSDFSFGVVKAVGLTGNWTADSAKTARLNGSGTYYKYQVGQGTVPSFSYAAGDIIGVAYDADLLTVKFYLNGSLQATITGLDDVAHTFYASGYASGGAFAANFGQDSTFAGAKPMGAYTDDNSIGNFQYAPPAGYLALCTQNLPTPTIIDGSEYFNTVLYTGTGAAQSITGANLAPDLLWIKRRNAINSHILYDSVRGDWELSSNSTGADISSAGRIGSLDADGFTFENTSAGTLNASGGTYAAWSWKAGGAAVSNTDGSITSQVSANVDAGFSIVSYTGNGVDNATIGHGLGVQPSMIITKERSNAEAWCVFHQGFDNNNYHLRLNQTDGLIAATTVHKGVSTSTYTVGTSGLVNTSGDTFIAYCFADVEGFSKAGSYTGNGTNQFIHTGFRPAFVLAKITSTADNWRMYDSARLGYNPNNSVLYPNLSNAEDSPTNHIDLLSNGFRWMSDNNNANGHTFIYLAFAEHPFKYANAR